MAADSRPRDESLLSLALFLAGTAVAATAAIVAGGFAVASLTLRPIRAMTADAAALTPSDPSRRLAAPEVVPELRSLAETLNSALDRIADSVESRRRFVANASHELRTPLAILLGNAELALRRERTPAEYRSALERQRRVASRLAGMTESLLLLARADDGHAALARSRVELASIVGDVCDELAPLAAEAGVSLEVSVDMAAVIDGDPAYLAALAQNLVANAIRFSPRGGIVQVGVARRVGRGGGGDCVLAVEDHGAGIPPEALPRIFGRFQRVRDGADPREGAGLGLAIAQWIATSHGGSLEVESRVGSGSCFRAVLPLAARGGHGGRAGNQDARATASESDTEL